MHLELISVNPAEPWARGLGDNLIRALGVFGQCVFSADPTDTAARRPDAFALLVGLCSDAALDSAYAQVLQRASGAPVVAVGEPDAHRHLQVLLSRGIADALFLPVSDGEMAARFRRALGQVSGTSTSPLAMTPADSRLKHIVGQSQAFARVINSLPMLAGCDAGVLVLGETGTGKEVFAQALHYLSPRASRAWVPVNCGAIPVELMESELFGHSRGAYTTAHAARTGLVEEAEGGTLFLDDVDCLPLAAQVKLLRLLQEREYRPVGSNTLKRADIRVIAASNLDLAAAARRGTFRQDLFYRLKVLSLSIPPLRERRDDIPLLALHFMQTYARQMRRSASGLSPQALSKLMRHDWPGNVRELQHTIERAVLLSPGPVLGADAIDAGSTVVVDPEVSFRNAKARVIEHFERDYLEQALARCNGNITRAARESSKHRRALFELLRKHRIDPETFRATR